MCVHVYLKLAKRFLVRSTWVCVMWYLQVYPHASFQPQFSVLFYWFSVSVCHFIQAVCFSCKVCLISSYIRSVQNFEMPFPEFSGLLSYFIGILRIRTHAHMQTQKFREPYLYSVFLNRSVELVDEFCE